MDGKAKAQDQEAVQVVSTTESSHHRQTRYVVGKLSRRTQDGEKIIAVIHKQVQSESHSVADEALDGTLQCIDYFRTSLEDKAFVLRTNAIAAEALKRLPASGRWARYRPWLDRQRFVIEQVQGDADDGNEEERHGQGDDREAIQPAKAYGTGSP